MADILIVDGSSSMRQMVSFTLKSKGHNVAEVTDGNAALARTKRVDNRGFCGEKSRGRAAGATGWLVKPFHPDSLMITMGKVLR